MRSRNKITTNLAELPPQGFLFGENPPTYFAMKSQTSMPFRFLDVFGNREYNMNGGTVSRASRIIVIIAATTFRSHNPE
jgi:hypothetical protein